MNPATARPILKQRSFRREAELLCRQLKLVRPITLEVICGSLTMTQIRHEYTNYDYLEHRIPFERESAEREAVLFQLKEKSAMLVGIAIRDYARGKLL